MFWKVHIAENRYNNQYFPKKILINLILPGIYDKNASVISKKTRTKGLVRVDITVEIKF